MSSPRGRSLSASCSARGCRHLGCSRSGLDQRVGGCWLWGRGSRCLQVAGSGAGSVSVRGLAMPRHRRLFTLHPLPAPIPRPRVLPRPGTHLQGRIRWVWSGCGVHVTAQPGRATVIADQAAGLGPSGRRSVRAPSLGAVEPRRGPGATARAALLAIIAAVSCLLSLAPCVPDTPATSTNSTRYSRRRRRSLPHSLAWPN